MFSILFLPLFLFSLDSQISVFVHSRKPSRSITFCPNFSWVQIQSLLFISNLIYSVFSLLPLVSFSSFTICVPPSSISSSLLCLRYVSLSVTASLYFFFFFKFGCTGPTTLDILIQRPRDLRDMEIREILQGAGALSVKDIHPTIHELMGTNKSSLDN